MNFANPYRNFLEARGLLDNGYISKKIGDMYSSWSGPTPLSGLSSWAYPRSFLCFSL